MLDFFGHIDSAFQTTTLTLFRRSGSYLPNGMWEEGEPQTSNHAANTQPAKASQIKWLDPGGERNIEARNVYINDGTELLPGGVGRMADEVEFDGRRWKVMEVDYRPTRNYCRALVEKLP